MRPGRAVYVTSIEYQAVFLSYLVQLSDGLEHPELSTLV